METFLKILKTTDFYTRKNYFRMRSNNQIELGHYSDKNKAKPDTILFIDTNPIIIDGEKVFRCNVNYYNIFEDTLMLRTDGTIDFEEMHKRGANNTYDILVQIDINRLFKDEKYYNFFMEELLKENRVIKYLEAGLQEKPARKCGNYIGYIEYDKQGNLNKYFDIELGKKCHNLKENIEKRRIYKDSIKNIYKSGITELEQQIERLKKEYKELNQEQKNGKKTK